MLINSDFQSIYFKNKIQKPESNLKLSDKQNINLAHPLNLPDNRIGRVLKAQNLYRLSFTGHKELKSFEIPFNPNVKGKLYRLDNGMQVAIVSKPGPTTIQTFVGVGSLNEPDSLRGISHLIEHTIPCGSEHLKSGEFHKRIAKMGAFINARTSYNLTSFFIKSQLFKKKDLAELIKLQAEIIQHPTFIDAPQPGEKKSPIEKQKIVVSEIQDVKNDIQFIMPNFVLKNLFNINASPEHILLGKEENIEKMNRQDLLDYHSKWYTPDNMITVIAGEVNPDNVIKIADKAFGNSKAASRNDKYFESLKPIQKTVRQNIEREGISAVKLGLGLAGPKNNDIRNIVISSALVKLLKNRNSRLTSNLGLFSFGPKLTDNQYFYLEGTFDLKQEEKALKDIGKIFNEIKNNPVEADELNQVKNVMKYELTQKSELSYQITDLIGNAFIEQRDIDAYLKLPELIDGITAKDIQNAAMEYLKMDKASIVMVYPKGKLPEQNKKKSSLIGFGSKNFINKKVPVDIEQVKKLDLPNNFRFYIYNNPTSAIAASGISFETNTLPPNKPGVAAVLECMLTNSTEKILKKDINYLEDLSGININIAVNPNGIDVGIDCPHAKLPMALDFAKRIILNPDFSKKNFHEAKQEAQSIFGSVEEEPEDRIIETLYKNNPLGYSDRLIRENIDNVSFKDVKDFYNYIIKNARGSGTVVANMNKGSEEKITNSLKIGTPNLEPYEYKPVEFSKPTIDASQVITTGVEDKNQAEIVQAFVGPERKDLKDCAALFLLNKILSHHLYDDLREKQALAYHTESVTKFIGDTSLLELLIEIPTPAEEISKSQSIRKALNGFQKHLKRMINEQVSQGEINRAKLFIKNSILDTAEPTTGKNSYIASGLSTKYGPACINELLNAIDKVTAEDIQNVAKKYLSQPSIISVVAGKEAIEANKDYFKTLGNLTEY